MKLREEYDKVKSIIESRLDEFRKISPDEYFKDLAFCLCTPQSKAKSCWLAVEELNRKDFDRSVVRNVLQKHGVRFCNNKSKYILEVRGKDLELDREWLVKNIKGLGMKEASHFLRNIGKGEELAILDRHILKNLVRLEVIDNIPNTLSKKKYLDIENKMKDFSKKIDIPLAHLDLLLWSLETGEIFK